ncbi:TIM barrel protein [Chelatococcus sp. SYSU_G07232]|uniref:3-dehydroshikimate dehydratase n=1 Tax=Chelatococcus albus TaxID=3047466 RepID=A0ABT7AFF3_9HYPH|nr:sugar phosphate isomerase/epimerase and 4-hydroxyphenylpyruvate domain-containing protein [Chelatococcus sp. SYSU_G07232]MDJ1158063.1 TIM barrel protein [Chelatococcus sp. SYSU_G07232]
MKTSIATVSLSGTLDEKLRAIAAAGFTGCEIFENDFIAFPGTPRDVGRMVSDLGLTLFAFQPFRDFEGLPEPYRARAFARAERKFDLMQELETDLLLVCSNVAAQSLGGIDRAAADLRELGERAARRGLRIGFEALAWGRHVNDYRDAWEIVRRADHPNVGIILDGFHVLSRSLPVEPIRAIPGDRIFMVQLADAPKLDLDILSWSRHFRCFPGQGDLPVGAFMQAVEATGFDGPLSLEIFNDQFRAGSAARTAVDGLRSLRVLEDDVARSCPGTAAVLPRRSQIAGVEFIEFAVDEEAGAQLGVILAAMGFRLSGRHVSKAVEHWHQGDINIVLNMDKEGFGHAHYITHGPGICALALRVTDVGETLRRAAALQAVPFSQPVGPGELTIPAIRGVGGSLIYFTEPKGDLADIWHHDFVPRDEAEAAPLLRRVDHVAQSMQYDEMLSWLLFYTSIFALEQRSQVEVADPGGLVLSRAVEAPDGHVRIVLNGSQAAQTMSGRFLSDFFGSGTQHVSFATDDIFAAVEAMRASGLTFLDIPDNYYDDLEARYDLAPERIAALRANEILYERNDEGEFFQVYTHAVVGGVFFEIVERRGYVGYGAANAPVRLAAQRRDSRPLAVPLR